MKNIFRDMTLRDISASYEGTIIQVNSPDDDGFYPAKLVEVSCDEYVYVKKSNGDVIRLPILDNRIQFKMSFPSLGMINVNDHVCYVSRRAVRQWKKGLRLSNMEITTYDDQLIQYLTPDIRLFGPELEYDVFNPKYTDFFEAIEIVDAGEKIARAISSDFCITNSAQCSRPLLMYRNNAVGVVKGTSVSVSDKLVHILPSLKRIIPNGYHNSILVES